MLKKLPSLLTAYWGATLLASAPAFAQGAIDPTFAPTILKSAQSTIIGAYTTRAMLQQPDAKILVGGNYEYIDNQRASRLRRLNADGTPDTGFAAQTGTGPDAWGNVAALALQSTNKILVGCASNRTYNSVRTGNLVRLLPNGSVDATFNSGGTGFVEHGYSALDLNFFNSIRSLAVQPDDKILVGGNLDHYNGQAVANLLRLNADGSLDASFNVGSLGFTLAGTPATPITANSGTPEVLLVQPDGKIVVGGNFAQVNGSPAGNLVRLNADGTRDNTFLSTGTNATVRALARQPDGKLLVGGYFTQMNGQASGSLVRLNADGTRDASFTPTMLSPVATATGIYKIRLRADGSLVVCGTFTSCNGTPRGGIAQLSATGVVDTGFGPAAATTSVSTPNIVYDLVDLPSGQTLAGGTFNSIGGVARTGLARLNGTATQVDAAFNPLIEFGGTLSSATPLTNGDIILLGSYTSVNGTTVANSGNPQRLNSSGAHVGQVTLNFGTYAFRSYELAPQPDGRFYVFGYTSTNTAPYFATTVVRLLASGALDTGFAPVSLTFPSNGIRITTQVVALPTGGVLFAGDFVTVNGQGRPGVARVSAAGVLDAAFNPTGAPWQTTTALVSYLAGVQPNGQPLVSWSDANQSYLVRLSATTGQVDNSFSIGSGASGSSGLPVGWLAQVAPGGQVIVSGSFTTFNGQAAPNGIVRLQPNGQPDPTFTAALSLNVFTIQPDGRILGSLADTSYFRVPLLQLTRLNVDGSQDATFAPVTVPQNFSTGAGLALQPQDGKILVFGDFRSINGQFRGSLVRLDNTLLATRAAFASAPELDIFPNPARQQVTLRLPATAASATAHPVVLFDVQGRAVRRFTLPARQTEITLPLTDVPLGVYVLQTNTAAGPAWQRVVVAQ
jgi:uncharacterized delta-60 repeat protein